MTCHSHVLSVSSFGATSIIWFSKSISPLLKPVPKASKILIFIGRLGSKHLDSLRNIVDKLISEGFLRSQINVLHRPYAKCANVLFDYSDNLTCAEWLMEKPRPAEVLQNVSDDNNLGLIVKQVLED